MNRRHVARSTAETPSSCSHCMVCAATHACTVYAHFTAALTASPHSCTVYAHFTAALTASPHLIAAQAALGVAATSAADELAFALDDLGLHRQREVKMHPATTRRAACRPREHHLSRAEWRGGMTEQRHLSQYTTNHSSMHACILRLENHACINYTYACIPYHITRTHEHIISLENLTRA